MKYFTNCRTLDELKKEYRRLAMIHHPATAATPQPCRPSMANTPPGLRF